MIYGVVKEVYNTVQLRNHLSEVETELNNITAENKRLTTQKEKLEDPDYVQAFARSNYLVSKEGEKVFYLPSSDNTENNK